MSAVLMDPGNVAWAAQLDMEIGQTCRIDDHACINAGNVGCLQIDHRNGGPIYWKARVFDIQTNRYGFWTETKEYVCSNKPAAALLSVLSADKSSITLSWTNPNTYNGEFMYYSIWVDDGYGGELTNYLNVTARDLRTIQISPLVAARPYTIRHMTRTTVSEGTYRIGDWKLRCWNRIHNTVPI